MLPADFKPNLWTCYLLHRELSISYHMKSCLCDFKLHSSNPLILAVMTLHTPPPAGCGTLTCHSLQWLELLLHSFYFISMLVDLGVKSPLRWLHLISHKQNNSCHKLLLPNEFQMQCSFELNFQLIKLEKLHQPELHTLRCSCAHEQWENRSCVIVLALCCIPHYGITSRITDGLSRVSPIFRQPRNDRTKAGCTPDRSPHGWGLHPVMEQNKWCFLLLAQEWHQIQLPPPSAGLYFY